MTKRSVLYSIIQPPHYSISLLI